MGADRADEYSPWRDARVGGGSGDAYLAFLVETLKPRIDTQLPDAARARAHRHHRVVDGRADQPLRVLPASGRVRLLRRDEPVALVRARRDCQRRRRRSSAGSAGCIWTSARARASGMSKPHSSCTGTCGGSVRIRAIRSCVSWTRARGTASRPGHSGSRPRCGSCSSRARRNQLVTEYRSTACGLQSTNCGCARNIICENGLRSSVCCLQSTNYGLRTTDFR